MFSHACLTEAVGIARMLLDACSARSHRHGQTDRHTHTQTYGTTTVTPTNACVSRMKAYDTARQNGLWYNGLWLKLWEHGVQGKMRRVGKGILYEFCRSAVLLDGKKSEVLDVEQGVARGCGLSSIFVAILINCLFITVEQAGLGTEFSDGMEVGG